MNINNGSIFRNEALKKVNSKKKFNLISPKHNNKINPKVFLGSSSKNKKNNIKEKNFNYRYKNYEINSNKNAGNKNKFNFLTPRADSNKSKCLIKESNKISYKEMDCNEKCFIMNNNLLEYNTIISLLGKILLKSNSYIILSKIKKFINKLLSENKDHNNSLNNSSYREYFSQNESRPLSINKNLDKNEIEKNNNQNIIKNKEELDNKNKSKNKNENKKENKNEYEIDNNILIRKIKKLNQKINDIEEKSRIEQLKYLFFIIEQEKKISELEKNFDNNQIPLDQRIIEKMKELKCLPNYYKPEINEEEAKNLIKKRPPLSGKVRNNNLVNNNSFLKSRNDGNNIKNKYSFDKEIDPIIKRNQSQILYIRKNNKNKKEEYNNYYNNNLSKSKSKGRISNFDESNEINEIKKNNTKNVNKSVQSLFNEKNFFISHPKLKYVKNSQEKNHFQKLKTKEQLNGISNLLSNINLGSKFQKSAVNDFSYYINNSMVNLEKLRGYHNYINIENKFEESLKLKRKPSL